MFVLGDWMSSFSFAFSAQQHIPKHNILGLWLHADLELAVCSVLLHLTTLFFFFWFKDHTHQYLKVYFWFSSGSPSGVQDMQCQALNSVLWIINFLELSGPLLYISFGWKWIGLCPITWRLLLALCLGFSPSGILRTIWSGAGDQTGVGCMQGRWLNSCTVFWYPPIPHF